MGGYISAIVLIIGGWSTQKRGVPVNLGMHMSDIKKCVDFLSYQEKIYMAAGRKGDIIRGLALSVNLTLPDTEATSPAYVSVTNKHSRDESDGEPKLQAWQPQLTLNTSTFDIPPHLAQSTSSSVPHPALCLQDLPYNTAALGQTAGWIDYEHHSVRDPHHGLPLNFDIMDGDSLHGTAQAMEPYPSQWMDFAFLPISGQNNGFFEGDTLWSSVPTGFQSDEWGNLIDELRNPSSPN